MMFGFLQQFITRKLLESQSFHAMVRRIHAYVHGIPYKRTPSPHEQQYTPGTLAKTRRFGSLFIDELKKDIGLKK